MAEARVDVDRGRRAAHDPLREGEGARVAFRRRRESRTRAMARRRGGRPVGTQGASRPELRVASDSPRGDASGDGSAAGGTRAGGAAIAVVAGDDPPRVKLRGIEVAY